MKDSVGGGLLLGLASMILLIFIIFVCFFINYGIVFKNKNRLINYIEQREGIKDNEVNGLFEYIKDSGYSKKDNDFICYETIKKSEKIVGLIYKVKLHMTFDKTILKEAGPLNLSIPISGETKTISTGRCFKDDSSISLCTTGIPKCK